MLKGRGNNGAWRLVAGAMLAMVMALAPISAVGAEGTTAAAVQVTTVPELSRYSLSWVYDVKGKDPSIIMKSGVTYVTQEQLANMLIDMAWDVDARKGVVKVSGPNHTLSWSKGSKYAIVNGIKRKLSGAMLYQNGQFYLPLRDVISWAGGTVKAANARELVVAYAPLSVIGGDHSHWYWLRRDNGIVYSAIGSEMPHNIGKSSARGEQYVTLEARKLTNDSTLLTVHDNYGEPAMRNDIYKLIVYKDKLVQQSAAYYGGFHSYASADEAEGLAVMLNGSELQLARPDGSLQGKYDLKKLTGYTDEPFTVPYVSPSEGIALVRPYQTYLMLLVDLRTGKVIELYKDLLPVEEQKTLAEMMQYKYDFDYRGDRLEFVKRDGDKLIFNHGTLPVGAKTVQVTYTLKQ